MSSCAGKGREKRSFAGPATALSGNSVSFLGEEEDE